jgi:lactate dehydrogenase-like 2-hydroxyacid dehydrogenase
MHIVVLDEVGFSAEQLIRLHSLPDVTVTHYKKAPKNDQEIIKRLRQTDIAVLAWTEIDAELLEQLPNLKMIAISQSGEHYVDVMYAAAMGITVSNVPGYAGTSVAELTMGLMLSLAKHIVPAVEATREHDYSWQSLMGIELRGKTLGIIGTGNIGTNLIRMAKCFNMKVVAHTLNPSTRRADQMETQFVDLEDLLTQSDFVTIQVPLTGQTYHLLSDLEFNLMKPTAYLISTTRGNVIDYAALRTALETKRIAGAAFDTILIEEWALTRLPNVLVTPRIGSFTADAVARKGDITINNIEQFLKGDATNVVSAVL